MINIKEYLMTRGNEERRVYHIVKNGRIDLLQQIFPDAETLVAKTENCREFGYDVMANLADDGNTGMLKKILFRKHGRKQRPETPFPPQPSYQRHSQRLPPFHPFFVSPGTEAGKI